MANIKSFNQSLLIPSHNSNSSYKIIRLPNGILTLLVSNPSQNLCSAAVNISSGSNNDPDEILGLAHLCEHLVLLGSKKFPNPNLFHDELTLAGGNRNAYTTGEQTCFYFEVPFNSTFLNHENEPYFNKLLEIFANSFINPLFTHEVFNKEIFAIDNEHSANKSNSSKMLYHGLRILSSDEHKFSRFATGNFSTINDLPAFKKVNVQKALIEYHNKNFVSEKISLVVQGPQSINFLQKLALKNFNDIKSMAESDKKKVSLFKKSSSSTVDNKISSLNNSFISSNWDIVSSCPIFTDREKNSVIFIKNSNNPILRINFPIYYKGLSDNEKIDSKFFSYIWTYLIGNESKNTIDSILKSKRKSFITNLNAFSQELSTNNDVLVLELKLTRLGCKNLSEIVKFLFNSNLFKNILNGDENELARFLSEMELIDYINFLRSDLFDSPMNEAAKYATNLQKNLSILSPENILKGGYNLKNDIGSYFESEKGHDYFISKAKSFKKFFTKYFNPNNFLMCFSGDLNLLDQNILNELENIEFSTDQYYAFDYKILNKFNQKLSLNDSGDFNFKSFKVATDVILLNKRNNFIPQEYLSLSAIKQKFQHVSEKSKNSSLGYITKNIWVKTNSSLKYKDDSFEVWVKPEKSLIFNSIIILSFDIISLNMKPSIKNTMNLEILSEYLKFKLIEKLYPSELLNYSWKIFASVKGDVRLGFTIKGFKIGINYLLKILINELVEISQNGISIKLNEFRKFRGLIRNRYNGLVQNNSISIAITGLLVVMEEKIWTIEDRLEDLDDIKIDDFKEFSNEFLRDSSNFTKIFLQGDFETNKDDNEIIGIIQSLNTHKSQNLKLIEPKTILVPKGYKYVIEKESSKDDFTNSICYFIQTSVKNDEFNENLTKLFGFLMNRTLVPDLRFKKQLGYAVLGGVRVLRSSIGLHISIMSPNFTSSYLEKKIEEYLISWENKLDKLTEKEFRDDIIVKFLENNKKSVNKGGDDDEEREEDQEEENFNTSTSSGPESLTADLKCSTGSSNCDDVGNCMKAHKNLKDLIFNNTEDLKEIKNGINSRLIKSLKKDEFMSFFKEKISVLSKDSSKVVVLINSQLTPVEIQEKLMILQLDGFLRMNGLKISKDRLIEIVNKSNKSPLVLFKELFRYFRSQGESFKLCSILLKEIVKQVSGSLGGAGASGTDKTAKMQEAVKRVEITDITQFQSSLASHPTMT